MNRYLLPVAVLLGTLGLVPLGFIAASRVSTSEEPRIHIIRDMDDQAARRAQHENPLFADGRAMRAPVPGTVARGELRADDHLYRGQVARGGGAKDWAQTFPVDVDAALLARGRDRYDVFCGVCHGASGRGDGMIERRVRTLQTLKRTGLGGWARPADLTSDAIREQPVGQIFNTVSNGKANMAGYAAQIPAEDRWAIVAYVRALQRVR